MNHGRTGICAYTHMCICMHVYMYAYVAKCPGSACHRLMIYISVICLSAPCIIPKMAEAATIFGWRHVCVRAKSLTQAQTATIFGGMCWCDATSACLFDTSSGCNTIGMEACVGVMQRAGLFV